MGPPGQKIVSDTINKVVLIREWDKQNHTAEEKERVYEVYGSLDTKLQFNVHRVLHPNDSGTDFDITPSGSFEDMLKAQLTALLYWIKDEAPRDILQRCPACQNIFVKKGKMMYCSPACSNRQMQREHQTKIKVLAFIKTGGTAAAAAKRFDIPIEKVKEIMSKSGKSQQTTQRKKGLPPIGGNARKRGK